MEQQYEAKFIFKLSFDFKNILMNFIVAIILGTLIAVFSAIAGPSKNFLINFVLAQSNGVIIFLIVYFSLWVFRPQKLRLLYFIAFIDVCCGMFIGLQIGDFILRYFFNIVLDSRILDIYFIGGVIFTYVILYFFITKERLKYREIMIEHEKTRSTAMEKDSLLANLKMLQAQIEPHFLFNTLSNILSLIDTRPDKGKSMLLDLTKYLRTSLSRTLPEKTTLSQEMSMIQAYLNIQKIRMDERLNYKIDVPDNICQYSFPPMLLQPLVENAITHGLEPKEEGGEIDIKATQENNILKIEVADTGLGFSDLDKPGVGIDNVRERLGLLFGEKGQLTIEENKPHGVRATIEVPIYDI
jgi:sensor histidine kinase YesM